MSHAYHVDPLTHVISALISLSYRSVDPCIGILVYHIDPPNPALKGPAKSFSLSVSVYNVYRDLQYTILRMTSILFTALLQYTKSDGVHEVQDSMTRDAVSMPMQDMP